MERKQLFNWKTIGSIGLGLVGILALMTSCAGGGPVSGGGTVSPPSTGGYPTNSITVGGFGEASGAPDVAYIDLGIDVTNADVGEAVTRANQTMNRVTEAIRGLGIADEDMQTINFNVWPEDRYDPMTGQPTGERTYHVQNTLHITVRDITQVGAVIEAGLNAGANNVFGLSFGIDDTSQLEAEARKQAVADARERAEQLANELGVKLGDPIIVAESYAIPLTEQGAVFEGVGGGAPPISSGQLTVTISIGVTFSIVQ